MIKCKTCDSGELHKKKKYRMSGIVVLIGYIILIPSILGILGGGFMCVAAGAGTTGSIVLIESDARTDLMAAGIPEALTDKIVEMQGLTDTERSSLSVEQLHVVDQVSMEVVAGTAGAGLGGALAGGASFAIMVSSLVGGLLGWLLVMKKKVLQCAACGATVAAS
jgi:hypothetical protein